jgi:hypothetical protein
MAGPDMWGPHGWKFLHFVTLGYPNTPSKDDKQTYKEFFKSFSKVIPCPLCAHHFQEHLNIHPLDDNALDSKTNLIKWGIDMHNEVNKIHEKKIYSYDEGILNILDGSKPIKCNEIEAFSSISNSSQLMILTLLIIILFLLFKVYKK